MPDAPALRAGDADRERAAAALRGHHLAGRLDEAEFEERLGRAYAARTLAQLAELQEDLPPAVVPARAAPLRSVTTGALGFAESYILDGAPDEVYEDVARHLQGALGGFGFAIELAQPGRAVTFVRTQRPWWVYVLCVALFPIGLVALTVTRSERVRADLVAEPDGRCRVELSGNAGQPVRSVLGKPPVAPR